MDPRADWAVDGKTSVGKQVTRGKKRRLKSLQKMRGQGLGTQRPPQGGAWVRKRPKTLGR